MRSKLLFLTPTAPMSSGNGLAMRAAMNLEVLSRAYDVYLTVFPLVNAIAGLEPDTAVLRSCKAFETVALQETDPAYTLIQSIDDPIRRNLALAMYAKPALCRFATPETIRRIADAHAGVQFDAVFVFRLYMVPYAAGLPALPTYLDMDDFESETRLRLATIEEQSGEALSASLERVEAQKYAAAEAGAIRRVNRVLLSSETDCARLNLRYRTDKAAVLPNGLHIAS